MRSVEEYLERQLFWQPMLTDLLVEQAAVNTQDFGGPGFIALRLAKGALDKRPFEDGDVGFLGRLRAQQGWSNPRPAAPDAPSVEFHFR